MQKVSTAQLVRVVSQKIAEPDVIKKIAIFCAVELGYVTMVSLLIYSYVFYNLFIFFLAMLSALFGRFVIHPIIHHFYRVERPMGIRFIEAPDTPSFPSGHATFLFGLAFMYFYFSFPLGMILSGIALIVSLARVFCGVHRLEDIGGSAVVAIVSTLIIYYF